MPDLDPVHFLIQPNVSGGAPSVVSSDANRLNARRRPPRVPLRRQLLKEGRGCAAPAAILGTQVQLTSIQRGKLAAEGSEPPRTKVHLSGMAPIRDSVSHSPNQSGLDHAGLDAQYESSLWSSGSPCSDTNSNWGKVIVDSCDKGTWPSMTGSDPDLASECMDADSTSSSGSEKNLSMMVSGGDGNGNRHGNGQGAHFLMANGSNNLTNGGVKGPWGAMLSTCSGESAGDKLVDGAHGKMSVWGSQGPATNGGINPSTLNPNANHGAWPVLQNTGPNVHGQNGGTNPQRSTIGQAPGLQSANPKMSWGSPQEMESEVNGTSKVLSGQPQNLNTEYNGPNNTTNTMTSSLPNSTGSAPGPDRAWAASTGVSPQLQTSVSNGTSVSQHAGGDGINSGSYGTAWGAPPGTTYSGDKCPAPKGQAVGDTVNATLMQPFKNNNGAAVRGGGWDAPSVPSPGMSWATGGSVGPPAAPRPWDSASSSSSSSSSSSNTGTKVSGGDWGALPSNNQHSNDCGNRKGTNGWKSLEDDALGLGGGAQLSQGSGWNKSTGSEGSGESSGAQSTKDGSRGGASGRRRGSQQCAIQTALSKTDMDPRVLSNQGWGQTPVRQNTAWDVTSSERKPGNGSQGWGNAPPQQSSSQGGWGGAPSANTSNSGVSGWGDQKPNSGWGDAKSKNWEDSSMGRTESGSWGKEDKSSNWNDGQKTKQGWGNSAAGEGWSTDSSRSNHWGESQKSGTGGWDRDDDGDRSSSGWSETGRNQSNTWGGSGGANTPDQGGPTSGWGDPVKNNQNQSGWGEPIKSSHSGSSWGEPAKSGPNADWGKGQDNTRPGSGTQNKPSGWLGGPMPTPVKESSSSSGWEEPSPESVRRRMEIDDGTSAWGDPNKYNYSNVNMWNKNTSAEQDSAPPQPPPPPAAPCSMAPKEKSGGGSSSSSGWGDPYPAPQKMETSSWAEPVVDKGTSAWGKPTNSGSSWEDSGSEGNTGSGWSQAQHRPAVKPAVQDRWEGDATPSNWGEEEEEVEIGMWNNNTPQEVNQSNWSYMKKGPPKMSKGPEKADAPWMNPFVKQFNSMNFSRDSEDVMKGSKMDVSSGVMEKRMDVDKHSVNMAGPPTRHPLHRDPPMDRSPYMEKNMNLYGGGGGGGGMNPAVQGRNSQQPLSSAQSNLRNQVPPPLLPSQVPPSLLKYPPNTAALNPLFNPQQMAMLSQLSQLNQLNQLNQLSQINQLQRLLQQKAQNPRAMPGNARPSQDQQARAVGMNSMVLPPRHMDPALLKQHSPTQPPTMHQPKPYMDPFLNPNTPEMHKDPHTLTSFSNFPLGLTSNLNVSNLDVGFKEPQSRLKKWTAMDVSVNSPLDQNPSKPGAMSSLRIEDPPFGPYDFMNSTNSPISPPGSVGDGWPPRAKSPHSSSVNWPPEFRPGEPWKGYPNIDPETDPFVTPGSVINNLSINTVRDVDHLRERNNGPSSSLNTTLPSNNSAWTSIRASNHSSSLSSTAQSTSVRGAESKWSPGSVANSSLAHELWKVPLSAKGVSAPSRPPPGLTGQKQASSWGNGPLRLSGWGNTEPRYTPGSSWGESSSGRTNWLVLKNLTPQIDGSTLRTLCMQHGPLITFHLNLPHGTALVCYSSKEEAAKAQKSLHMCVLGNTTILADFASEEEINRFFAQGQSMGVATGWQTLAPTSSRLPTDPFSGGAGGGAELHSSSALWGGPGYSGSLWGSAACSDVGNRLGSPSPMSSFLPVDHLSGSGDSM